MSLIVIPESCRIEKPLANDEESYNSSDYSSVSATGVILFGVVFLRVKSHFTVVRGVVLLQNRVLLVRHERENRPAFWCFPGGFVEEGETVRQALAREIKEETHLEVEPGRLVFVQEFVKEQAIELFFLCSKPAGHLKLGTDPENAGPRVLADVAWKNRLDLIRLGVRPLELGGILVRSGEDDLAHVEFAEVLSKE